MLGGHFSSDLSPDDQRLSLHLSAFRQSMLQNSSETRPALTSHFCFQISTFHLTHHGYPIKNNVILTLPTHVSEFTLSSNVPFVRH